MLTSLALLVKVLIFRVVFSISNKFVGLLRVRDRKSPLYNNFNIFTKPKLADEVWVQPDYIIAIVLGPTGGKRGRRSSYSNCITGKWLESNYSVLSLFFAALSNIGYYHANGLLFWWFCLKCHTNSYNFFSRNCYLLCFKLCRLTESIRKCYE